MQEYYWFIFFFLLISCANSKDKPIADIPSQDNFFHVEKTEYNRTGKESIRYEKHNIESLKNGIHIEWIIDSITLFNPSKTYIPKKQSLTKQDIYFDKNSRYLMGDTSSYPLPSNQNPIPPPPPPYYIFEYLSYKDFIIKNTTERVYKYIAVESDALHSDIIEFISPKYGKLGLHSYYDTWITDIELKKERRNQVLLLIKQIQQDSIFFNARN